MKEAFTKDNIENWLVEFLTSPLDKRGYVSNHHWFYAISKYHDRYEAALHINKPGNGYELINLYDTIGDGMERVDLDHLPEHALALLAIIHREAYEYYKKIVQGEQK